MDRLMELIGRVGGDSGRPVSVLLASVLKEGVQRTGGKAVSVGGFLSCVHFWTLGVLIMIKRLTMR
jgi:hypothetical protein